MLCERLAQLAATLESETAVERLSLSRGTKRASLVGTRKLFCVGDERGLPSLVRLFPVSLPLLTRFFPRLCYGSSARRIV
jgi:hypothetical protein